MNEKKKLSKKANKITPSVKNPLKDVKKVAVQELRQLVAEVFKGPLPPPNILKQYNTIDPTFADRIIKMAEREQSHRHRLDKEIVKKRFGERRIGQILGFLIGCVAIICGTIVANSGHEIAGGLIGSGGVAGLVAVFVYGRKSKADKDKNKD